MIAETPPNSWAVLDMVFRIQMANVFGRNCGSLGVSCLVLIHVGSMVCAEAERREK